MTTTVAPHIRLDERGVAWIDDTNVKVIEVALEKFSHGSSAEEIHGQHQGYLSLAQIHAALTWYYDHQVEMDAEIQRQAHAFDQHRSQALDSPGRRRLRAMSIAADTGRFSVET